MIDRELARRQQGYGAGPRMKLEQDTARLLGGVMDGVTTAGGPLAMLIENLDHAKWRGRAVEPMTAPRPGHADLTGAIKYGYRDLRLALERASARETAARVAAGAACKRLLAEFDIRVGGYVAAIGQISADLSAITLAERLERAEASEVRCPDPQQGLATCEGKSGVRFSFRKRANPAADQILLQFKDGASTNLWSLRLRTDGRLQVQQDQAIGLTTTAGSTALADNVWYTVRLVYDRAAGGVLKVWLNVPLEIDATHAAAGTSVDQITVSGPASPNQYHYDDFSITDSAGFQPFGQITRRDPVAVGSLTQFDTPTPAGAHYLNVAEVFPDVGTFNQHAAGTLATDLYALANSPTGRINGVKGVWWMRRGSGNASGGTHDYAWRENGVNRTAEFLGLTTSWTMKEVVWETPPHSGGNWNPPGTSTSPKFDALELGACHNGTQAQDTDIGWAAAMVDFDDGSTQGSSPWNRITAPLRTSSGQLIGWSETIVRERRRSFGQRTLREKS